MTIPVTFLIWFRLTWIQLEVTAEDKIQPQTCFFSPITTAWHMLELRGRYVPVPEGIQQEFPFSRALSGVLPPMEEEAES